MQHKAEARKKGEKEGVRPQSLLKGRFLGRATFLERETLMNVRNDATAGNRCLNQTVQLLVAANSELQMTWRNTLYFQVLTGIARKLKNLRRKVLQNSRGVHGGRSTDALLTAYAVFEVAVNAADRELETCS